MSEIKGFFYGVDENNIYELKYTTEFPAMAMVNCPCEPVNGAAWNNWDDATEGPIANYWLTYEMMSSTQILVDMAEVGKSDYFVFASASWDVLGVLVCTRTN